MLFPVQLVHGRRWTATFTPQNFIEFRAHRFWRGEFFCGRGAAVRRGVVWSGDSFHFFPSLLRSVPPRFISLDEFSYLRAFSLSFLELERSSFLPFTLVPPSLPLVLRPAALRARASQNL